MTKRPSLAESMKAVAAGPTPATPMPGVVISQVWEPVDKKAARTRVGMKRLLTPVAPNLHRQLKQIALDQDTTLEAVVRAALETYVSQQASNRELLASKQRTVDPDAPFDPS
jgi:hypothetical protein